MQKSFIAGIILVFALLVSTSIASAAQDPVAQITISYTANYNPPNAVNITDMSPYIYVGNNAAPYGTQNVFLPLAQNQVPIIDQSGSEDVPGLYVERGRDAQGTFLQLTAYGQNDNESRESIKFTVALEGVTNISISNGPGNPYEDPMVNDCAINEGNPQLDSPGNDEYSLEGATATFCSITHNGIDRVRIYYTLNSAASFVITDLTTTPSLPVTKKKSQSLPISVSFTSSRYPITVHFKLFKDNVLVDYPAPIPVPASSSLPITYTMGSGFATGAYELRMLAISASGEQYFQVLGTIHVRSSSDNDDDDDHDVSVTQPLVPYYQQNTAFIQGTVEDPITLKVSEKASLPSNWLLWVLLIATIVLVVVLIILVAR